MTKRYDDLCKAALQIANTAMEANILSDNITITLSPLFWLDKINKDESTTGEEMKAQYSSKFNLYGITFINAR